MVRSCISFRVHKVAALKTAWVLPVIAHGGAIGTRPAGVFARFTPTATPPASDPPVGSESPSSSSAQTVGRTVSWEDAKLTLPLDRRSCNSGSPECVDLVAAAQSRACSSEVARSGCPEVGNPTPAEELACAAPAPDVGKVDTWGGEAAAERPAIGGTRGPGAAERAASAEEVGRDGSSALEGAAARASSREVGKEGGGWRAA